MKNFIKFLMLLCYLITIFYINNIWFLLAMCVANICIMKINRIKIWNFFKTIILLIPFVFFTSVINFFLVDGNYSTLMGIRLILSYMISYLFINVFTIKQIVNVIDIFLFPLKWLKINYKQISLIIYISISIVPVILNELQQKICATKSKTIKINLKVFVLIIKSILLSLLLKVNEYEDALSSKGYMSN